MGTSLHQSGDVVIDAQKQLSYRIISVLGEGNSGITYKAKDINNNNQILAIKVLSFVQSNDWKMMELFEREAKVLSILKHSGIPRYINYFYIDTERDRKFYIVQELALGKSLTAWVEDGLRWNEASICQLAEQILRILMYLQRLTPPVIHRDIKPQNIIRDCNQSLRLVDFGAVRDTYYSTLMRGSTIVGTYGYMAPEQFRGHAVPATDLYGLGATILYLLTHRSPAEIPQKGLTIDFRSHIKVSEGLANWLEKILAPDANDRYPTAQSALNALRQLQKVKVKKKKQLSIMELAIAIFLVSGTALWVGNANKWRVFSTLGILPRGICSNSSILRNYLKNGGNPNASIKNVEGLSRYTLLSCVSTKDTELLLKYGANPNLNKFILQAAILKNDLRKVQLLLKYGAKPDESTLLRAVNSNRIEIVKLLLQHGAKPNEAVWLKAVVSNRVKIIKLLLENGTKSNDLILGKAVVLNRIEAVKLFLRYGANPNSKVFSIRNRKFKFQSYLIHRAVSHSQVEMLVLLINNGANINIRDASGYTPLDISLLRGRKSKITKFLLKKGAITNKYNNQKYLEKIKEEVKMQ
ncbi:MAG: ankyrin repeat domain-containing protein [Mastigocoleus sp.]|mgnify:CR=1 FL=1